MINQQLLDFIKSQLSKGVDKETITKELLGSGWVQADIQEGFNAINTPVINPIINPIINPVVSNSVNNSVLSQTTNHSGKKVLLIIVVLFIITVGVSGYYFRNDIPVIKDLIKSKSVPVSEIKQKENTQTQIQKEEAVAPQQEQNQVVVETKQAPISTIQVTKSVTLFEKDCGVSKDTPLLDIGWEDSYQNDPALKCFGESATNCINARVVITGGNIYDKSPAILQIIKNNDICTFKFTGYQNKYNQCFINIVKELDINKSTRTNFVYKEFNKIPSDRYAALIFNYASIFMPLTLDKNGFDKLGCNGDLSMAITSLLDAGRAKMSNN